MRLEILAIAVAVGACIWAFRVLPMRMNLGRMAQTGPAARFIAATGVAAIATLFASAMLPEFAKGGAVPAALGCIAVIAAYLLSKSVVGATMAGAAAYGLGFAVLG